MQSSLDQVVTAYEKARARADVANDLLSDALRMAVVDMRDAGATVREIALHLRVPKSTVWRHLKTAPRDEPPMWGNRDEYLRARREIWSHAPDSPDANLDWCPWAWEDTAEGRSVRRVPSGPPAVLARSGNDDSPRPDWLASQYHADVKAMGNAARTAFEEKDTEGEAAVTAACWVHRHLRWPERDTDDLRRAFILAGGLPTHPDTLSPDEQQEMLRRARDAAVRWNKRQGRRHERLRRQNGVNEDLLREVENDLLDIVRLLDRAAQGKPVTPIQLSRGDTDVE